MNVENRDIKALLAANIRAKRRRIGHSQQHLAELAGISTGHMNDIEQGRKWVSPETLKNIAEALMTEPWTLLVPEGYRTTADADYDLMLRLIAKIREGFTDVLEDSWHQLLAETAGERNNEPR